MATTSQQWAGGLAPDQQRLLLAALESNKRKSESNSRLNGSSETQDSSSSSMAGLGSNGVNPSLLSNPPSSFSNRVSKPAPDFNPFDFGPSDPAFDFSTAPSTGDFTDSFPEFTAEPDSEPLAKRKMLPEDAEDDEEDDDSDHKRRDSDEWGSKKPGRKPSTSEPTTKRKAQNRAAQRAFRERKEKHLKDLESKVNDLEKASESANHENSVLRAQVERLNDELKDYRRRMSTTSASVYTSPNTGRSHGQLPRSASGTGFDFDFDFPHFGGMSGSEASPQRNGTNGTNSPEALSARSQSQSNGGSKSPPQMTNGANGVGSMSNATRPNAMSSVYGNGIFDGIGVNGYNLPTSGSPQPLVPSRSQTLNGGYARSSPSHSISASSKSPGESQVGQTSSYCTSPDENWANDYQTKKLEGFSVPNGTLNTGIPKTPGSDFNNSFDWLATQNGGQFDPVLFGDYRESQDNILGTGDFSGGFFDDALPNLDANDLFNFNMPATLKSPAIPAPSTKKPNLMEQVEQQRDGNDQFDAYMMNQVEKKATQMMTCPEVWESLRKSEHFQSGDFDVDALCSDLTSKAKCTETGLSLPREAVEAVLWKMATKDNRGGQQTQA